MQGRLVLLTAFVLIASCKENPVQSSRDEEVSQAPETKAEPKTRVTYDPESLAKYQVAVAQLRSMHDKSPFQSSGAVVGEFNKLVGTDGTLASGGTTFNRMDVVYSFKIGKEQFPVLLSGRMEGSVQKVDCIQFRLDTFEDSPYEFEILWEWVMPWMGGDQSKNAEQGGAGEPATRVESDSKRGAKPQTESEGRFR